MEAGHHVGEVTMVLRRSSSSCSIFDNRRRLCSWASRPVCASPVLTSHRGHITKMACGLARLVSALRRIGLEVP